MMRPRETNTPLLDAILTNHTEIALQRIADDPASINEASLGNTPLLLALKTGNLRVVMSLLSQPGIDIEHRDYFGMSALHWACFLRLDDVIAEILKHNPTIELTPKKDYITLSRDSDDDRIVDKFKQITPADFYCNPLLEQKDLYIPEKISDRGGVIMSSVAQVMIYMSSGNRKKKNIDPAQTISIGLTQIPLTSLAFHMDTLCVNYCGSNESQFIRSCANLMYEDDDRSDLYKSAPKIPIAGYTDLFLHADDQYIWRHNFDAGYLIFQHARNDRPVNHEIHARLLTLENPINNKDDNLLTTTNEAPMLSQNTKLDQLQMLATEIERVKTLLRKKYNIAAELSIVTDGEMKYENTLLPYNMTLTQTLNPITYRQTYNCYTDDLYYLITLYNEISMPNKVSLQPSDAAVDISTLPITDQAQKIITDKFLNGDNSGEESAMKFLLDNKMAPALMTKFATLKAKVDDMPKGDMVTVAAETVYNQAIEKYNSDWFGKSNEAELGNALDATNEILNLPNDMPQDEKNEKLNAYTEMGQALTSSGNWRLFGMSMLMLASGILLAGAIALFLTPILLPVTLPVLIVGAVVSPFLFTAGMLTGIMSTCCGFFSHANRTREFGEDIQALSNALR